MQSISTKELPAWFKLSRYDKLDQIELRDWFPNLAIRSFYLRKKCDLEKYRKEIEAQLHENGNRPLICPYDPAFVEAWILDPRHIDRETPLKTLTVKPMTVYDVAWLFGWVSAGKVELTRRISEAAGDLNRGDIDDETYEFLRQPINVLTKHSPEKIFASEGCLSVDVDLAAPDKVIIDDFSRWLAAARSEFDLPAQKVFTEAKRDDLVNYRVLPYLDLTLWAGLEQVTISHAVMADALFPDVTGVDVNYRVRKVTKRHADWAIDWSTIESLARQILNEA